MITDLRHLITKDAIFSASIEDILRQNDIPYAKQGTMSDGITAIMGNALQSFKFFVPPEFYNKAKDLIDVFFD